MTAFPTRIPKCPNHPEQDMVILRTISMDRHPDQAIRFWRCPLEPVVEVRTQYAPVHDRAAERDGSSKT